MRFISRSGVNHVIAAALLVFTTAICGAGEQPWFEANAWPGNDIYPMGPIGGRVEVKSGWPEAHVKDLIPGCPGELAGLKINDVIVGANGKAFQPAAEDGDKAGKGPLETLGYSIDDSEGSDGKLVLDVLRGGKTEKVTVQLKPVGSFSATFPANCPKSQSYYDSICAHLASIQHRDGEWDGGEVTSDICALALLGRADGKYIKNVKLYAEKLITGIKGKESVPGSNWMCGYDLVFLGEYYWATGDARVSAVMQNIMEVFAKRQGDEGHFGHGTEKPFAYGNKGLIMPASACMWGFSMAEKCGIAVPRECWDKFIAYVHKASGTRKDESWVGYNTSCVDTGQANGRTGNICLAMYISERDRKWSEMMGRFLAQNKKFTIQGHAVTTLGSVSAVPALYLTNPKGHREYMDYWKWYLRLTQLPNGNACYLPSRGNIGGDYYLHQPTVINGTIGLMLASAQGNLYMYGKFLKLDGVSYFNLQPKLKAAYDDLMTRKYSKSAIEFLRHQTAKDTTEKTSGALSYEDREIAGRMLAYLHKEVIEPGLATVQAAIGAGDMFAAKVRISNFEKTFAPAIFDNDIYKNQMALLAKPENQALIETGFRYYTLALRIERARDPKSRLYVTKELIAKELDKLRTEFAESTTPSIYKTLAQGKVAAPDSNPVPAELLDNGHVYAFKGVAGKNTAEAMATSADEIDDAKSWDSRLIARLRLFMQAGKKPKFEKEGMENKVQITEIDAGDRIRLLSDGSDFFLAFEKLSLKDKSNLALELVDRSLKEDCQLAKHFLIACGRAKKAEEFEVPMPAN